MDRGFVPDKRSPPPYYNRDRPAPHFRRYSPNQGPPPRRNYDSPPNYHRSHREPGMGGGYGPPRDGKLSPKILNKCPDLSQGDRSEHQRGRVH